MSELDIKLTGYDFKVSVNVWAVIKLSFEKRKSARPSPRYRIKIAFVARSGSSGNLWRASLKFHSDPSLRR
jgi:hypothetical protein